MATMETGGMRVFCDEQEAMGKKIGDGNRSAVEEIVAIEDNVPDTVFMHESTVRH